MFVSHIHPNESRHTNERPAFVQRPESLRDGPSQHNNNNTSVCVCVCVCQKHTLGRTGGRTGSLVLVRGGSTASPPPIIDNPGVCVASVRNVSLFSPNTGVLRCQPLLLLFHLERRTFGGRSAARLVHAGKCSPLSIAKTLIVPTKNMYFIIYGKDTNIMEAQFRHMRK